MKKNNSLSCRKLEIHQLIECGIQNDPELMISILKNCNVITNMYNKLMFYDFFKLFLDFTSKYDRISYKFSLINWKYKRRLSLKFFKNNNKYPYMTFVLENRKNKLLIEILPL